MPARARTALGTITAASLWSTVESPNVFRDFVLALSEHAANGAVGITMADHACVGAFLIARSGQVVDEGEANGDEYLDILPPAVERAFSISLGLTSEESLFFTEGLLGSVGFGLAAGGGAPVSLSELDVKALVEADGQYEEYLCALGI